MSSNRRSSPPSPEYSRRESRRVRTQSSRPEKYAVAHLPRHVVGADNQNEADAEKPRANWKTKFRRRARFTRRLTIWELGGFALSCVACAFLVREIGSAQGDFRRIHSSVAEKQTQFRALDKQNSDEKKRLAHLKSEKGREQLLAERGYLRPGDRILLFPADKKADAESRD